MVAYSAANYVFLPRKTVGKALTFATLCADLCVLVWLVSMTGGLRSPLLAAQLLFTILFVVLFPTPFSVVPPLLTFPVVAKLDQVLGGHAAVQVDLFILLWYSAINCILVYVMVYLNERDRLKHRELQKLSSALRDMAIVDERNRLAREIHDGLGGVLSSVVIQSEYLLNMIDGSEVRARLSGNSEARGAILPIQDRGRGFALPSDPEALSREGHYGLANMHERAKKVSGEFRMTSAPGKGTCIEFAVNAGEELER